MNLPPGTTLRDIDNLCQPEDTGASEDCCICRRHLKYDTNRNYWRLDDICGEPATVMTVKHGEYVCGAKCHSQYVYNNSTPQEREDMRLMALMCEAWLKVEYSPRRWSFWSYSQLSINPGMLDDEITNLLAAFGMEDGENPPAWYVAATAPKLEVVSAPDVQFVQQGLGVRA